MNKPLTEQEWIALLEWVEHEGQSLESATDWAEAQLKDQATNK